MKKILSLEKVIGLQKTIETMISDTQVKIIANNPVLISDKSKASEVDVPALYKTYNALLDQLNVIKLAKDKGNRKRTRLGGVTNQELILDLSNCNRKLVMLTELFKSKQQNRKGKKAPAYEFAIPKTEIADEIDSISNRISDIKKSMTKFNKNTTVRVVIFEELNLL